MRHKCENNLAIIRLHKVCAPQRGFIYTLRQRVESCTPGTFEVEEIQLQCYDKVDSRTLVYDVGGSGSPPRGP